jgi:YggT family protein
MTNSQLIVSLCHCVIVSFKNMEFILFFLVNLIRIVKYAILARVLMSWIGGGQGKISQIIYEITEPILRIFRNILPRTGMIDFSSLIAFFALDFLQIGVISLFANL